MSNSRQLPNDPALPALPELFPENGAPAFVGEALRAMCGADVDATKARIRYVRYRQTKSCVVLWIMRAEDGRQFWISARMFHDARGASIASRASFQTLASTVRELHGIDASPYAYDAERQVLLQLFPLDSRMQALTRAGSMRAMSEKFSEILGAPARVVSAAPVSYKPWRRCVYRYGVDVEGEARFFFGKLFLDDRGGELMSWQAAIDDTMRAANAPWRIVQPVAHLADDHMLLLEAVEDGVEVKDMLKEASEGRGPSAELLNTLDRIAAGLPAFQAAALPGLPEMPPAAIVEDYVHGAEGLDIVVPEFAASAFGLLETLGEQARTLPPEGQAPSHGAFRYDQFILKDGALSAIDLDTLCRSGVSADAGNFLGYLDVMGVRRPELRPAIDACAAAFERAALALPGVTPEWLAWYRAAAHVKKALRAFYSLDLKWPRMTAELAEHAARSVASGAGV